MNLVYLPLNEITSTNRFREDMGDIAGLADSISRCGQLLPLVINQDKRLVDGGRRLAALNLLNAPVAMCVYRETLTEDELHELEIEANKHKQFTWYEKCLGVAHIHKLKQRRGFATGDSWTQAATGELLGLSVGNVNYCLKVAKELNSKDKNRAEKFRQCDSLADAWRLLLREQEDKDNAEIARREKLRTNTQKQEAHATQIITEVQTLQASPDLLAAERERYSSNPLNTVPFDEYWEEKTRYANEIRNTIYISNKFILGDSIAYMNDPDNTERFDHIITDIPYGIDMDMLDQSNPHGGMVDLDTVIEEHDHVENKDLIGRFFTAAFKCTKPTAFVITWCDIMLWQYMYDLAVAAGFKVQRWPITWNKSHQCMNQTAQFNFTKSTEIALVCRKPGAVLMKSASSCVVTAANTEMRKLIGHPFAKPYECWNFLTSKVCLPGQVILEPFAGRGSGVISMLRDQLNVFAVELNVAHYNALLENVKREFYLKQNPKYVFK